ncbi:MFS general substrate transporter [Clavulina sp. PMI_390]|nr:MFS general substrate transporter [Clavulina sp. PMI_390]
MGAPAPEGAQAQLEEAPTQQRNSSPSTRFWLVYAGVCASVFLAALEFSSVGTALPTIVKALNGTDFIWVGSAYALASAASMPPAGGLSNIFGRKPLMLGSIALFALGSALAGAAQSMNMLVAARAVQGAGGGGILTLTEIIIADMVPLRDRGKYTGFIGGVWSLASVLGPPVGGALSTAGQWRWIFYINVPLSAASAVSVYFFLHIREPSGNWSTKLKAIDWIGNGLIIASTASVILALTWGGVTYPWDSARVLVPLLVGFSGMAVFLAYEGYIERQPVNTALTGIVEKQTVGDDNVAAMERSPLGRKPTIPLRLLNNRTSLSGYLQTFIHGLVSTLVPYYMPTYFQAAKLKSAIISGVLMFPTAFVVAPVAIMVGASVASTGKYRPQMLIAWPLIVATYGILSLLRSSSSIAMGAGLQVPAAIALGLMYIIPQYPVQAPLDVRDTASALALMFWFRQFGQTFGITVGITILQNTLTRRLPSELLSQFPAGAELSYALVPRIPSLAEPLRSQVRDAFSIGIRNIWYAAAGLAGLGLLVALPAKGLPLSVVTDENWGLEERQSPDEEKSVTAVEALNSGALPAANPSAAVSTADLI